MEIRRRTRPRLSDVQANQEELRSRLRRLENKLHNLHANLLAGVGSTTLQELLKLKGNEEAYDKDQFARTSSDLPLG